LQVAALQGQLAHPEDARKGTTRAQETASDRAKDDKAGTIVARNSVAQTSAPPPPPSPAPMKLPSPDSGPRIERKTEPESKTSSAASVPAAPKTDPAPAPVPPLFSESSQVYSMVGTITDVKCAEAPQILITLKSQTIVMKLHADNLAQLSIKSAGGAAAAKGANCSSLRGRNARISYLFVTGKPWDAEMQSVEFRNLP